MNKYKDNIFFGKKSYKIINDYFINNNEISKIFILVDENTKKNCLNYLLNNIHNLNNKNYNVIEIISGEKNKNIFTCLNIWKNLIKYGADRKSILINLGGGIISDIGGFTASVFKRGIKYINIPTTVLSMVDASLGGKTGIDFESIKNEIGTFSHPEIIIIDSNYLVTLPAKEIKYGFIESIKHALIADKNFWIEIKNSKNIFEKNFLKKFIKTSILIKKNIVKNDFKETGIRKILNFGHTIGHALETYFLDKKHSLLHGEAVVIGIICEAWISLKKNLISKIQYEDIYSNIKKIYGSLKLLNFPIEKIISIIEHDKKNENGKIKFSLLNDIGKSYYNYEIEKQLIEESLMKIKDFSFFKIIYI